MRSGSRPRGLAALAFDYRCWGDNEGEPRRCFSLRRPLVDWRAAVACARRLEGVKAYRGTARRRAELLTEDVCVRCGRSSTAPAGRRPRRSRTRTAGRRASSAAWALTANLRSACEVMRQRVATPRKKGRPILQCSRCAIGITPCARAAIRQRPAPSKISTRLGVVGSPSNLHLTNPTARLDASTSARSSGLPLSPPLWTPAATDRSPIGGRGDERCHSRSPRGRPRRSPGGARARPRWS
jgi:hypothetical protein